MNNNAIEAEGLRKSFGHLQAVNGIDFTVRSGEIFSLLGPNGAGKSTTISMLSCLLTPTSGDARIMGHSILSDQMAVKRAIGVVPQEIALYEDLSARENLSFWGKMYGLRGQSLEKRVDEVLEVIGLVDRQKDRVEKYSGGMKRRVNIGIALLNTPQLVIMDEPTVGIDPQSRRHILDNVRSLNEAGATILYTTHYMEEAQELSDHIAIMDQGEIIAYGNHEELVSIVGQMDRITLTVNGRSESMIKGWQAVPGVDKVIAPVTQTASGDQNAQDGAVASGDTSISLLVDDSNVVLPSLFEVTAAAGIRITSVEIQEPNLEAVFLHLTGRALRD